MSDQEVVAFLAEERTMVCATIGPRGWPHLMPLWFVLREAGAETSAAGGDPRPSPPGRTQLWAWTYGASQKTRNLERDPRATVQVEAGETYDQLRGVMFETDVVLHRDQDVVADLGREIFARYATAPGETAGEISQDVAAMVARQAAKRVALQFVERRRASWDHRKLGGAY